MGALPPHDLLHLSYDGESTLAPAAAVAVHLDRVVWVVVMLLLPLALPLYLGKRIHLPFSVNGVMFLLFAPEV